MVMNLLRPLEEITGIKEVHFVSTDEDHFPYLRFLEKSMTGVKGYFGSQHSSHWYYWDFMRTVEDKTEQAEAGNKLAQILKIKPCY